MEASNSKIISVTTAPPPLNNRPPAAGSKARASGSECRCEDSGCASAVALWTRGRRRSSVEDRKDCLSKDSLVMNEPLLRCPGFNGLVASAMVAARIRGRWRSGDGLCLPDAAAVALIRAFAARSAMLGFPASNSHRAMQSRSGQRVA